jgi:hypothetical protein
MIAYGNEMAREAVAADIVCQNSPVVFFEIRGEILGVETFAAGKGIRKLPRLRKIYGKGRWRKRKGFADVKLPNG